MISNFLEHCIAQEGKPYIWGAKGPDTFDCSGLVTYALHKAGGPDWRATHSSARLFECLPVVTEPEPGDLCFYGSPERVTHVMVVIGDKIGRVIGASGGNGTCTTLEIAKKIGAAVKFKSGVKYRPDLRGFRRLACLP